MAIRLLGESFRPLWDTRCAIDHIVRLAFAQAERDRRLEARLKRQAHWLGYELSQSIRSRPPDRFLRNQPKRGSSSRDLPTQVVDSAHRRMLYADSRAALDQARCRFLKKWRLRCPAVIECLDEAGEALSTLLRFSSSQWKALRTTNALERINEEFRRRPKTQASLPGKTRSSYCSSACCEPARSSSGRWTAGTRWGPGSGRRKYSATTCGTMTRSDFSTA